MPSDTNLKQISSISAVFPAYNDAGTIPSMVLIALMALREVTDDFEVIVTNDGSRDDTGKVLDELARRYPELKVIHHPVNQGYGCALRTGFANASKDWIFYTDGDGQYDPKELINLTQALTDGIDVVNGFKITRHDPLIRVIIGRIYHHIVKIAFGFKLKDVDCDFRLICKAAPAQSAWRWLKNSRMPAIISPKCPSITFIAPMENHNSSAGSTSGRPSDTSRSYGGSSW